MKRILLLAFLLFPSIAWGQCNGVFGANTVCGSVAGGVPGPALAAGFPAGIVTIGTTVISGGTNLRMLYDNGGVFGEYTAAQVVSFTGAITGLTGDVSATGPGSVAATLATVNANVGTFGSGGKVPQFTVNGKGLITAASETAVSLRTRLAATTTYYVNSSAVTTGTCGAFTCQPGSDATPDGTSITTPYQTIQAAANYIKANIDSSGPNLINIQLTCGRNYTAAGSPVAQFNGPFTGAQPSTVTFPSRNEVPLTIVGDATTPSCATLDSSTNNTIEALWGAVIGIEGVTITSTGGSAIDTGGGGGIMIGNVVLGATASKKVFVHHGSTIENYASFSITGNSTGAVFDADYLGTMYITVGTITFTGNITAPEFIHSARGSDNTFTAAISTGAFALTGSRFLAENGGNITSGSGSLTYFPGTTAGSVTSGGSYDGLTRLTSALSIDASGTTGPAAFVGTMLTLRSADTVASRGASETFGSGAGAQPGWVSRRGRGTAAAPTAAQSGDALGIFASQGYGATGFSTTTFNSGIIVTAAENFTDAAQGAQTEIWTTPVGSTTIAKQFVFSPPGGLYYNGVTGGDKGAGTLNVSGLYEGGNRAGTSGTSPITVNATTGAIGCATCGVTGSPLSQFAATTSAQLAGTLSDETGSGLAVFGTSPTITTPNIVGVTDASVATAGSVGQYIATSCSANAATITVTIASPAVVTFASHGLSGGDTGTAWTCPIVFTTTGALPTGITAGTTYWVIGTSVSGNTFQIATSIANALAGTAVNTSGSQSGVHTGTEGFPMVNNTAANVGAISLTAGDWTCSGNAINSPAGSTVTTAIYGFASTASATYPPSPIQNGGMISSWVGSVTGGGVVGGIPSGRINVNATTTLYLESYMSFTTSTNLGYGFLGCRRVR